MPRESRTGVAYPCPSSAAMHSRLPSPSSCLPRHPPCPAMLPALSSCLPRHLPCPVILNEVKDLPVGSRLLAPLTMTPVRLKARLARPNSCSEPTSQRPSDSSADTPSAAVQSGTYAGFGWRDVEVAPGRAACGDLPVSRKELRQVCIR